MRNKGLMTIAAIVAVVAFGGIGFAALANTTVTVTVNGNSGTWYVTGAVSATYTQVTPLVGSCVPSSTSIGPISLGQPGYSPTLTATLFPGDSCVIVVNVDSAGTGGPNIGTFTYATVPGATNVAGISESDAGTGYSSTSCSSGSGTCDINGFVTITLTASGSNSLVTPITDSWVVTITAVP